jgi:ABC-type uncharacterized transport system substrate-binding protein
MGCSCRTFVEDSSDVRGQRVCRGRRADVLWADYQAVFEKAAMFVDKILKGVKPADLPVEQPTKFELVINLTTAKVLRLELPPQLPALTDRVIE